MRKKTGMYWYIERISDGLSMTLDGGVTRSRDRAMFSRMTEAHEFMWKMLGRHTTAVGPFRVVQVTTYLTVRRLLKDERPRV